MQAKRPFSLLPRLRRDAGGNVLPIVAAAILPLIGMVGSGIDMGRAYVAKSRLQQACDAGVLAARKKLGSNLPPTQAVIGEVKVVGNEFFDLNFEAGRYDTKKRTFNMTLESDFAITGAASVELPTAVMGVFGYNEIDISVECGSRMNFTNLDIMMVLDVTGSMRHTNSGDTLSRIDSMREVIKDFHANLELAKAPDTRVRYGFVPYSTNVNVGHLLEDDWVVDDWDYQSREDAGSESVTTTPNWNVNWTEVSGTRSGWIVDSTYAATWNPPANADDTGYYSCDGVQPEDTIVTSETYTGTTYVATVSNPDGTETREKWEKLHNGSRYRTTRDNDVCTIESNTDDNYLQSFDRVVSRTVDQPNFLYKQLSYDVSDWRDWVDGCIEERASTKLSDFSSVDLTANMDLDINTVPSSGNDASKWRPHFPHHIYARSINDANATGSFTVEEVETTEEFADVGWWWFSACPSPAQKLQEMTDTDLETYLNTLSPYGATYHDVGMIWGGRLLSQNGLFASENKDVSGNKPTSRHMIFLTDGQTEPYDMAYSAYGVEPLDQRRWDSTFTMTLAETIEERFKFACGEVKKNNTTVWIIAFGTTVNDAMVECAGSGYYFEAQDADELDEAFKSISRAMGDLRISS